MLKIFGAPSRYIQGPDAIDTLGASAALFGSHAVLVIDSYMHKLLGKKLAALCAVHQVKLHSLLLDGDLTPDAIVRLCAQAGKISPPLVIAVGGGKAIDAGKAVSKASNCHLITVPTVASNDAPTSKNYVLYDENHNLLAVEHMLFNPTMVIVDTSLIATAPAHFFRAGLGDAISKKFEAEQCFRNQGKNMFDASSTLTAQLIADGCFQTLLREGEEALSVAGSGKPTPAFERVVEAMILMSGLGFESGGLSIAHALTRGLPCISGVGHSLHGLQVALGLLVQLDLEKRSDTMHADLKHWYKKTGLPTRLADIGATAINKEEIQRAATLTLKARHARNFDYTLTEAALTEALLRHA